MLKLQNGSCWFIRSLVSLPRTCSITHKIEGSKELWAPCLDLLDMLFGWADFDELIWNKQGMEPKNNMKSLWTSRVFAFAFIIPISLYLDDQFHHLVLSRFPMVFPMTFSSESPKLLCVFQYIFPNSTLSVKNIYCTNFCHLNWKLKWVMGHDTRFGVFRNVWFCSFG